MMAVLCSIKKNYLWFYEQLCTKAWIEPLLTIAFSIISAPPQLSKEKKTAISSKPFSLKSTNLNLKSTVNGFISSLMLVAILFVEFVVVIHLK